METNAERRRKKLETFCNERGLKAVAEAAGLNWQYIDQAIKKTLLPAKKDGTRGYRKMSDEAFEKIEDAFKLGRGWFDGMGGKTPSAAPPPSTASLAETLAQALEVMERTCANLAPVLLQPGRDALARWARGEASTAETVATLDAYAKASAALLQSPTTTLPTPVADKVLAAKPITRTVDIIKKAAEEK